MSKTRTFLAVLLATGLVLGGCSEDDPTGPSSSQELEAVTNALINSGALGGFGAFALFAFPQGGEIGSIPVAVTSGTVGDALQKAVAQAQAEGWDAIGFQVDIDLTYMSEPTTMSYTGIASWYGLDVEAETVEKTVTVFAIGLQGSGAEIDLSDFDEVAGTGGFAYYIDGADTQSPSLYFGETGTFSISTLSFGSLQNVGGYEGTGITVQAATGTMAGSFTFDATDYYVSPPVGVNVASTFTGLPSVKVTMSGSYPN